MGWYKPLNKLSAYHDTPFGCCAAHTVCMMGKKACVWEKDDLDYARLCSVYRRRMQGKIGQGESKPSVSLVVPSSDKPMDYDSKPKASKKMDMPIAFEQELFF